MNHSGPMRTVLLFMCSMGMANSFAEGLENINLSTPEKRQESLLILQKLESTIRADYLSSGYKHPSFEPNINTWSIMLCLGRSYEERVAALVPRTNLIERQLLEALSSTPSEAASKILLRLLEIAREASKAATKFFYRSIKTSFSLDFFRKKSPGGFSDVITALTKVVDEDAKIRTAYALRRAPQSAYEPAIPVATYYLPPAPVPTAPPIDYEATQPAKHLSRRGNSAKVAPWDITAPPGGESHSRTEARRAALENLKAVLNQSKDRTEALATVKPLPHSVESSEIATALHAARSAPHRSPPSKPSTATVTTPTQKTSVHVPVTVNVTIAAPQRHYRPDKTTKRQKIIKLSDYTFTVARRSSSRGLVIYYPALERQASGCKKPVMIDRPLDLAKDGTITLLNLGYDSLALVFIAIEEFSLDNHLHADTNDILDLLARCRLKAGNIEHLGTAELLREVVNNIRDTVSKLKRR